MVSTTLASNSMLPRVSATLRRTAAAAPIGRDARIAGPTSSIRASTSANIGMIRNETRMSNSPISPSGSIQISDASTSRGNNRSAVLSAWATVGRRRAR